MTFKNNSYYFSWSFGAYRRSGDNHYTSYATRQNAGTWQAMASIIVGP